jgi:putative transposase
MPYDSFKHHRRSIRLRGYDYSQAGAYFVTICVQSHQCLFGDVIDAESRMGELGVIADECWQTIPQHFPYVELDEYVVMPNHFHGIVVIGDDGRDDVGIGDVGRGDGGIGDVGRGTCRGVQLNAPTATANRDMSNPFSVMSPKRKTLSVVIRTFKATVTTGCREIDRTDFAWLRNYYEHIIRNEREWNAIAEYIRHNPAHWQADLDNSANFPKHPPPKTADEYWNNAVM